MSDIHIDDEIVVRRLTMDDVGTYFNWMEANRDHLARWLPQGTFIKTLDDARAQFAKWTTPEQIESRIGGAIIYRDEYVGDCGLGGIGSPDNATEMGYSISESEQGKGIVTRVCRKLIEMAFLEQGVHRIMIRGATENLRSRAIPERLGFTFEGLQREAAFVQGNYLDLAVYSMLAQEWENAS